MEEEEEEQLRLRILRMTHHTCLNSEETLNVILAGASREMWCD